MHCPNCGTQTSASQSFCRTCGLGLEKIASSLNEQLPERLDANLRSQKERFEKLGMAALSIFGAGIAGLLLYLVIYKKMIAEGRFWEALALLGVLLLMSFGLVAVYFFAKANEIAKARTASAPANSVHTETLEAATRELLPEGNFEPIPSIVEDTTELLPAGKKLSREE